jgi:hypothetical protein
MRPTTRLVLLRLVLATTACASSEPPGDAAQAGSASPSTPTFATLYTQIFSRQCLPCHAPGGLMSELDLSSEPIAYHSLTTAQPSLHGVCQGAATTLLIAGDCMNSLLYRKLIRDQQPCGSRMPLRDVPVSDDNIAMICAWIQAGVRE